MGKLTDVKVRGLKASGVYGDGDRLYLRVQGQAKSWLLIYTGVVDGVKRRRELGLGGYPAVSLGNARFAAEKARDLIATGGDPIAVKRVVAPRERTLADVCDEWVEANSAEWSPPVAARYRGYVANHLSAIDFKGSSER